MTVIDLDRPAATGSPRKRRTYLLVITALLVGVMLGATATFEWHAHRQEAVRYQTVSVFVFADASQFVGRTPGGAVVLNGRVTSVTLTQQVTLVNAGPVPVNIRDLTASRPGVTVRGMTKQRWIAPGETLQTDADVQVDCARGLPLGRLPLTIAVQTVDEVGRLAQPKGGLDSTPWSEQAELACAGDV